MMVLQVIMPINSKVGRKKKNFICFFANNLFYLSEQIFNP